MVKGPRCFAMTAIDLTMPATLKWISREIARERPFLTLRDAVRVAMQDLRKGEFLTACIVTVDESTKATRSSSCSNGAGSRLGDTRCSDRHRETSTAHDARTRTPSLFRHGDRLGRDRGDGEGQNRDETKKLAQGARLGGYLLEFASSGERSRDCPDRSQVLAVRGLDATSRSALIRPTVGSSSRWLAAPGARGPVREAIPRRPSLPAAFTCSLGLPVPELDVGGDGAFVLNLIVARPSVNSIPAASKARRMATSCRSALRGTRADFSAFRTASIPNPAFAASVVLDQPRSLTRLLDLRCRDRGYERRAF